MRLAVIGLLAGCSFSPQSTTATTVTIVDDDFTATALLVDGTATPWGTLEPAAFVIDGLHARAFAGNVIDNDDTFDDVVAKLGTPTGSAYRQQLADHADGRPRGLGLGPTDYTLLYDGEILLPFGVMKLELVADDRAIAQIAQDGSTFGQRLFASNGSSTITLDVRRPGWFPIRLAYSQADGPARAQLAIVQGATRIPITADRLRARVTAEPGLVAFAFDGQALVIPRGETGVGTIAGAFGTAAPPYDLPVGSDAFALRHAGQLRIDTAGTYTFTADVGLDADDMYRLWIDDVIVATTWSGAATAPTGSIELAVGWHDLVFDYADASGNAQVELRMNDAVIDPAQLRPAVARGLVATHVRFSDTPLPDPGETRHDLDTIIPELAVIDNVDYGFGIKNHPRAGLAVVLGDCIDERPLDASSQTPGLSYHYTANDARCAGLPLAHYLRFIDSEPGNGEFIDPPAFWNPLLVASYHGGDRTPFARSITVISAPVPTPGALRLAATRVTATAAGAAIELSVRTAVDEAALADTPWTVVDAAGTLPAASELVQYQLAISTDGWQYPVVDKVELDYVGVE